MVDASAGSTGGGRAVTREEAAEVLQEELELFEEMLRMIGLPKMVNKHKWVLTLRMAIEALREQTEVE